MAALRESTRQSRVRPLRNDDPEAEPVKLSRSTSRPFVGLAQVCRQIRAEFLTWFASSQEIGVDLLDVVKYVKTFFNTLRLTEEQRVGRYMPFFGNLTIAVPWRIEAKERNGIEILPLLTCWAWSNGIEAAYGRVSRPGYSARQDGEAKDL